MPLCGQSENAGSSHSAMFLNIFLISIITKHLPYMELLKCARKLEGCCFFILLPEASLASLLL